MQSQESAHTLRSIAGAYFNPYDSDRRVEMLIDEMQGEDYVAGQRDAFDQVFHILHGLADYADPRDEGNQSE